jgi:hypothetical protein
MSSEDYLSKKLPEPLFSVNKDVIRRIKYKIQCVYND